VYNQYCTNYRPRQPHAVRHKTSESCDCAGAYGKYNCSNKHYPWTVILVFLRKFLCFFIIFRFYSYCIYCSVKTFLKFVFFSFFLKFTESPNFSVRIIVFFTA
jgi:hypothetical protein